MKYKVIQPFCSVNRRFNVGDYVTDADDLSPHTIGSAQDAGLLEGGPKPAPKAAALKGDE